jgi:hypothetical protein
MAAGAVCGVDLGSSGERGGVGWKVIQSYTQSGRQGCRKLADMKLD